MKLSLVSLLIAILALAIFAGCAETPTPIPTPTPTPDMGRLSDESVKEMLWLYHIMLPPEYEAAVNKSLPSGSALKGLLLKDYGIYANLYLAARCLNGAQASPSDFRKFVEPLLFVQTSDRALAIILTAQDTIKQIISSAQARKQLGLSPIKEPCERPYIAPQSAAEAELATGLIWAYYLPRARLGLGALAANTLLDYSRFTNDIAKWFNKSGAQEIGFLEWYCTDVELCGGWPAPTPTLTILTPTPTGTPTATPAPSPTPSPTATATATSTPGGGTTVQLTIQNFRLEDRTVRVGDTVVWTQRDAAPHTTTSGISPDPNGIWNSGTLQSGRTFSFTFTQTGVFPYFCAIHPSMTAVITVVES